MTQRSLYRKPIAELLEDDHETTLKKTDELQEILTNLRYEGRASFGRNLKETGKVLDFFKLELVEHVNLEEKVLFPFLRRHFPKLESAVGMMEAEHGSFRKSLRGFEQNLHKLSRHRTDGQRTRVVESLRETGTYLIYLLRHHLEVESRTLYRVLDRELRQEERKLLSEKLKQGHARHSSL